MDAPSIERDQVLAILRAEDEWMNEIILYKIHGVTPDDPLRKKKVLAMATSYRMVEGKLYKTSFGRPLLRFLTRAEADRVMEEIDQGICAAHQGTRTLARNIVLQGYYWPRMVVDCFEHVRKCQKCQEFAVLPGKPASFYTTSPRSSHLRDGE